MSRERRSEGKRGVETEGFGGNFRIPRHSEALKVFDELSKHRGITGGGGAALHQKASLKEKRNAGENSGGTQGGIDCLHLIRHTSLEGIADKEKKKQTEG